MSEKRPFSPESKHTYLEHSKRDSSERRTFPDNSEQLKSKEQAERTARKELEDIHESKEHETSVELISEEENLNETTRITKDDKQRAYNHTLKHVQSRLSKPSKRFSKIIHNPAIERASEAMEKTVARPSGILGGALFATVGLAIMNFFARRYGFALSGTELMLFVSAGWLLGLIIEFVWRKLIKNR